MAATTPRITAANGCGPRPPTARLCRSRWCAERDQQLDGSAPCLLYGYGSYEYPIDPSFSQTRLNLLERGFVFAIAHVRGGGELGRPWYEQGRLMHKRNTFTDFIACAERLVADGWTSRGPPCHPGRQRRRAADGRGHQHAPGPVQRGCGRSPVCRRGDHDVGREPPAHRHRMGGMGQPARRRRSVRLHEVIFALRQRPCRRITRRCT